MSAERAGVPVAVVVRLAAPTQERGADETVCLTAGATAELVGLAGGASDRQVNAAAMRDLKRRPHRGPIAERLKGTHHR